ncbi:XEG113 protein [Hibiscus syriacus]|uniref:XEG113 protein n=1 Tax=Hibiscus syriacus TaxID=106335 RepID=A0A6A2ZS12_HIBSY|nr:XEG113 protein [Hibiscus syriacus]
MCSPPFTLHPLPLLTPSLLLGFPPLLSPKNGVSHSSNSISQPTGKALQPGSNQWRPILVAPPITSKMPPLESFRLTKELVGERAKDNVIIVTFGNFAFMDFILTWVKHLADLGVSNFLVGAMDTKLLETLYWKGVPVFDKGSHMSTIDNPLPYLARYPDADILTSSDLVVPPVVDDRLADWKQEWKGMLLSDGKIWGQNGFNELVRKQTGPAIDDESGSFYVFDGNLKLGILQKGSMTRQPFLCPLDHVFEVNVMLKDLPEEEFEGTEDFHASSNSSRPVHNSVLFIQGCQSHPILINAKRFSRFRRQGKPFHQAPRSHAREEKFRNRMKRYVGIWCCVENHTPGHIYYDMYWDEKPGWKPAPPETPEEDHPPFLSSPAFGILLHRWWRGLS